MGSNFTTFALVAFAIALLLVVVVIRRRTQARRLRTSDESDITAFTRELFVAQTTSELRSIIARQLPTLLRTTRVWVSAYAGGRRQLIVPGEGTDNADDLLGEDFQEWTTLPLRARDEPVGLIGVDTETARDPRTRDVLTAVAPFIGQALQNAYTVDVLREASLMDGLTGTATRREGLARLHAELKRAQRTRTSIAVMLLDLDRFKAINDRSGHAMGDAVLTAVGQTLRRTLRASDIRCRWGGEEFLVVLPDTDVERAQVVAQGLLKNIGAATVPTADGPVGTTTSIGLTMTRPGEMDIEGIIHRADVALYRAKNAGRSCLRVLLPDEAIQPPEEQPAAEGSSVNEIRVTNETPERTLPFPDRRNPNRPDRRGVRGPGRRATDPR